MAETCFIVTAALEYSGGDVEEAKRLLRKVTFRYFGQTWGESLFIADGEKNLPDVAEVVGTLIMVSEEDSDDWEREVVGRSAREMIKNPIDIPLYIAQIPNETIQRKADALYQEIAGLSYWEMDVNRAALFLFDTYSTWKQMQTIYDRAPKEMKAALGNVLSEARSGMRRLARVVLGRDLIHPGEYMGASNGLQLTYDEVLHFLD